jgi:hypothetical protein
MGKGILILILGTIGIFGYINLNINTNLTQATETAAECFAENRSMNICNCTVECLLSKLGDDNNFRCSNFEAIGCGGSDAKSKYRIVDTLVGTDSLVKIQVKVDYFNAKDSCTVLARMPNSGFGIPLKSAIMTNNNVHIQGNMTVDGRDHDLNGNVISNNGIYAFWSTGNFSTTPSLNVGGTDENFIDYPVSTPGDPNIIKTNKIWPDGYPDSPDKVMGGEKLGFSEGTLKKIAQSGLNGSQYTTNPNTLIYPLKGVTYVEADYWKKGKITGSGIFVMCNSAGNSILDTPEGNFAGIIIADDLNHIHLTRLLGAVVTLTNFPSAGKGIGSGKGSILYSEKALFNATKSMQKLDYGFGKHRVSVISWLE